MTSGFVADAYSQEQGKTQNFKDLRKTGTARVMQVISPYNLLLDDGRVVRLSGLEFPDFDVDNPGLLATTARDILKDMLEGQTVTLYQTRGKDWGRVNVMGHTLAHLVRQKDGLWVQGALLRLGLARVETSLRNPEMAADMLDSEQDARAGNDGLWPTYPVRTPEETSSHLNSFQIVQGRVLSAALKNNTIYLNFGPDWKTDFTAVIAAESRRAFTRAGLDPLQWRGHTLRVRGWLEDHNGPSLTLTHAESVEILDQNGVKPEEQSAPLKLSTPPGTLMQTEP